MRYVVTITDRPARLGRYKLPLIVSGFSAILCFALLLIAWHGNTPSWQALFVFFGGFATGIAQSAVFVDVAATVDTSEVAIASSGLYLSGNIGMLAGVSAAGAVFTNSLKYKLAEVLTDWPGGEEVTPCSRQGYLKVRVDNIPRLQERPLRTSIMFVR